MTKNCSKCKLEICITLFSKHRRYPDGLQQWCSPCRKKDYEKNKHKVKKQKKRYREQNKGKLKEYYEKNKHRIMKQQNEYTGKRRQIDLNFKLKGNLRTRLRTAIKEGQKTGSAIEDLGCSIEFLKQYLSDKFKPGMTWENYGFHGWHIDHIIPLSLFDLSNPKELKKACHYTNLQPLWAAENIKKSNKTE